MGNFEILNPTHELILKTKKPQNELELTSFCDLVLYKVSFTCLYLLN